MQADEQAERDGTPEFRTFKLPPPRFDAREASERELLVYGLPHRPNPETHPTLTAQWDRIAGLEHEFVAPELQAIAIRRHVDEGLMERRQVREAELTRFFEKDRERGGGEALFDLYDLTRLPFRDRAWLVDDRHRIIADIIRRVPQTSNNWSGGYVGRPAAEPIMTVAGEWQVPAVNPPMQPSGSLMDGTYLCVVWVGIDGTSGSADVLQAGTGSECVVKGGKFISTRFFAWSEWFANPWVEIVNFPVSAGHRIACTVCAPFGNTHGTALFNNLTTGQTTTIGIDPPAGTSLSGNVAEWIVEDPSTSSNALFPFPVYSGTTFTNAVAGTRTIELNAWDGTEIDMVQGGVTLSSGEIVGRRRVFCHYGP